MALLQEYKQGLKTAELNLKNAIKANDKKVNINFLKHRIREFKKQIKEEQQAMKKRKPIKKHVDTKSHNINVKIGNTKSNEEFESLQNLNKDNTNEINRVVTKLNNIEFDIVTIQGYLKNKNLIYRAQFVELNKNRKLQYNALKKYLNTLVKFR